MRESSCDASSEAKRGRERYPRSGSRGASIRRVVRTLTSSEVSGRPTAGSEGDPAGPDANAGQAARPFGVVKQDGVQTTDQAGSQRAEGAGDKTLEADQGHESMPDRVIATRQLGRRTPRRVRIVTKSR